MTYPSSAHPIQFSHIKHTRLQPLPNRLLTSDHQISPPQTPPAAIGHVVHLLLQSIFSLRCFCCYRRLPPNQRPPTSFHVRPPDSTATGGACSRRAITSVHLLSLVDLLPSLLNRIFPTGAIKS